jgi:hypothetical protein
VPLPPGGTPTVLVYTSPFATTGAMLTCRELDELVRRWRQRTRPVAASSANAVVSVLPKTTPRETVMPFGPPSSTSNRRVQRTRPLAR